MIFINIKVLSINMYAFFITFLVSCVLTLLFIIIFMIKSIREEVEALNKEKDVFYASDREFKISATNTSTRFFGLLQELTDRTSLRTNLILDQIDDLKRVAIKKEEFERLFELLKREKVLIENANDESSKKAYKQKWDMFETALGGKREEKE